jgi:heat shock protein HslJ
MRTAFFTRTIVPVLFLLGVTTACGNDDDSSPTTAKLVDREFLLHEAKGYKPVESTVIRLSFSETELRFSAGCNGYFGSYKIDEASIVVDGMGSTEMGCSTERHAQDEWLANFFMSKPTFALNGDKLTVTSKDATLVFLDREVADPDRSLTGRSWKVDTLLTADAASSIATNFEEPSVYFEDSGNVRVETGCNTGVGKFKVSGGDLTLSDMSFTESKCQDTAASRLIEHLTEVLADGIVTYSIEAARLTLKRGQVGIMASTE